MNFKYIKRCFDLARLGFGQVSPNPSVGAVIVNNNRIIGEGYHPYCGGPHAEVMAVNSISPENKKLLPNSTIYVSLEPCNVHGRTPPCTSLIINEKITKVVFAQKDFSIIDGVQLLKKNGIEVIAGAYRKEGFLFSLPRNIFVTRNRPYIILKFAKSKNNFFAPKEKQQLWLTNSFSKMLVHKWRTETDAILIGSRTAKIDNPSLTARLYPGRSPVRMLINRNNDLNKNSYLLDGTIETHIFCQKNMRANSVNIHYHAIDFEAADWLEQILALIKSLNLQQLTVEGGAWLINQFIEKRLWDEARVFEAAACMENGIPAPTLFEKPYARYKIKDDQLFLYYNSDIWDLMKD